MEDVVMKRNRFWQSNVFLHSYSYWLVFTSFFHRLCVLWASLPLLLVLCVFLMPNVSLFWFDLDSSIRPKRWQTCLNKRLLKRRQERREERIFYSRVVPASSFQPCCDSYHLLGRPVSRATFKSSKMIDDTEPNCLPHCFKLSLLQKVWRENSWTKTIPGNLDTVSLNTGNRQD